MYACFALSCSRGRRSRPCGILIAARGCETRPPAPHDSNAADGWILGSEHASPKQEEAGQVAPTGPLRSMELFKEQ